MGCWYRVCASHWLIRVVKVNESVRDLYLSDCYNVYNDTTKPQAKVDKQGMFMRSDCSTLVECERNSNIKITKVPQAVLLCEMQTTRFIQHQCNTIQRVHSVHLRISRRHFSLSRNHSHTQTPYKIPITFWHTLACIMNDFFTHQCSPEQIATSPF